MIIASINGQPTIKPHTPQQRPFASLMGERSALRKVDDVFSQIDELTRGSYVVHPLNGVGRCLFRSRDGLIEVRSAD